MYFQIWFMDNCRGIFRSLLIIFTLLCAVRGASASDPTLVSPWYFGPNAFPIPEMMDRTSSDLRIEAVGNYFAGTRGDHTADITLKAIVPLFTHRANLSVWLPVMEWYHHSYRFLQDCNIKPPYDKEHMRGRLTGDVYVTTDIQILEERRIRPDVTLRAGLKTASGGGSSKARYYDCPGYFFDAAVGKTFTLPPLATLKIRLAASAGFLCWQTAKSQQNDAVMYAVKLAFSYRNFLIHEEFAGYSGWEHLATDRPEIAHDNPMILRTFVQWTPRRHWSLFFKYGYGITDYPYRQFGIGVAYTLPILGKRG